MKQLLQLAPLMLCLAACQSSPDTLDATIATPPEATGPAQPKAEPATSEHIEPTMLTITGLPTKEISTAQLTRQLGRPVSIAKGTVECGSRLFTPIDSPDGDLWYYGKTMYEVSGSQAILCSFDVTSGRFRGKLGKLVLDKNTTLEDVRRFYPVSRKATDTSAGTSRSGEEVSLPFYRQGKPTDESLLLLFSKGCLQRVEFFSPC